MFSIKTQIKLWKILIFLEVINYQVVTVICNDFIGFKFIRDIILLWLVIIVIKRNKFKLNKIILSVCIFFVFIVIAVFKTDSILTSFTFVRRYMAPIVFLITIINFDYMEQDIYDNLLKYLLNLFAIFSVWGIFQAYVLGPSFLIKIGYPTKFSYAYNAVTLKDSFYFGNLGIQRVVGTISNSNACALILGCVLLSITLSYKKVVKTKFDIVKLICIFLAYILTFSRANILAFIIVAIFMVWKYVPHKRIISLVSLVAALGFLVLFVIQDESGITHKLVNWVVNSLTFKESSVAGRGDIWKDALNGVMHNPLGLGFGYTGANVLGVAKVYYCENSYLAIAIDLGIMGFVAFLLFIGAIIGANYKYRKKCPVEYKIIQAILLYAGIAFMFSNHIYDKEADMIIYFLIGITMQLMSKRKEYDIVALTNIKEG